MNEERRINLSRPAIDLLQSYALVGSMGRIAAARIPIRIAVLAFFILNVSANTYAGRYVTCKVCQLCKL